MEPGQFFESVVKNVVFSGMLRKIAVQVCILVCSYLLRDVIPVRLPPAVFQCRYPLRDPPMVYQ